MSYVKLILWVLVVLFIVIAVFAFSSANSGEIEVDLLFGAVTTSVPMAFTVAFALGWLFGLGCMSLWAFKMYNERRTLRRSLRVSESEVSSLRNLPLTDAD